jgi:hypothetical protein
MKTTQLLVIASLAAASVGAFAQSQSQEGSYLPDQAQSSLTTAQVRADFDAYRKAGVNPDSMSFDQLAGFHGTKSRADVRAEYLASRDQVNALTREDSGSAYLTQLAARHQDVGTNLAGQPVNTAK